MNDLILLAALLKGPQHGYALKKLAGLLFGQDEMHNNLVYPLLRRFMENSWVVKRTTDGQRGQKRDLYALTFKGKLELLRRLSRFTEKEASSDNEFRLRVGLFSVLDRDMRERILEERDRFLGRRQGRLNSIQTASTGTNVDAWGCSVTRFYLSQIRAERRWVAALKREAGHRNKGKNRIVES